jgi:hypothetical protein
MFKKIKFWFLLYIIGNITYTKWLILREKSVDEHGNRICYCGHTDKCECANPTKRMFIDAVKRGNIILNDKNNGWKTVYVNSTNE